MKPSIFNLRVPVESRNEVFLLNTLTDAQLLVSPDVAALLDRAAADSLGSIADLDGDAREALTLLSENGFIVRDRAEDRRNLDTYMTAVKTSTDEFSVTLLTTLQCNFACDYCYQGDHGDYNLNADKMSLDTAGKVGDWIERELDRVRPKKFVLTFFGGEPLLNTPVMFMLAERMWHASKARGVDLFVNIITNGLL